MNLPGERILQERVLVLARTAGDADLRRMISTEAGFACHFCSDLRGLGRELERGAGALIFAEQLLTGSDAQGLVDVLRKQPTWSDLPILVLTAKGADSPAVLWAMEMLGNVTLLERPVRMTILVSALRTALKARRRQYELRHQLLALRQNEDRLRLAHREDFGRLHRQLQSEERLLAKFKEADRRKDEFLATLAHELRNPLALVSNAAHVLLLQGLDRPEMHSTCDIIERQVKHLGRLVDDLLDVSRITRGKINLLCEKVSLALVVGSAVEASRPVIEAQGHELSVMLPPEPIYLNADAIRLSQVFQNLLVNAAKYTDRGGRIGLTAEREGSDVVVRVKDTGIGIAPDMLRHIFEMFAQVDRSLERTTGGLGIGLTLVERLVQMHGGSVEAHSDGPGKGSEFVVRLPLIVQPLTQEPLQQDRGPVARTPACRILVVDDNRDSADSLAMMLQLLGHDVHTAYDGLAAVETANNLRPDVVLMDIGLPKLNGYDAARRLRGQPWAKKLVIIAQSGRGQNDDRQGNHESGFDNHLVKPVDPTALAELLATLTAR